MKPAPPVIRVVMNDSVQVFADLSPGSVPEADCRGMRSHPGSLSATASDGVHFPILQPVSAQGTSTSLAVISVAGPSKACLKNLFSFTISTTQYGTCA